MRDGWTETTLGNIAEVVGGGTPSTSKEEFWDGDVVWLTPTEVTAIDGKVISDSKRKITQAGLQSSGARVLPKGTVILTSRASVGFVALAGTELTTNQGFQSLIPSESVDGVFLMFWIQMNREEFESRSAGSTFKEISKSNVKSIAMNLPPWEEQKRIVDVVSSVDAYIDAMQQQADTARTARNAVLHELLSAGGDDWTETTLNLISHNVSNRRIPITKSDRNPGKYPYYGASGIVDYVDSYIFDERTLLISEDGANLTARSTPIAFGATGKYWVNNHAHVLKFDEISTQTYVEYYLNSIRIDEWVSGAAQPKLNQKSLNEIPIQLPPLGEQKRIVEIVSSMDEVIQATEQALVDTKNLRSGLLSDLLSGEHEIPESYDVFVGAA